MRGINVDSEEEKQRRGQDVSVIQRKRVDAVNLLWREE